MPNQELSIHRTGKAILYFQLEGLCTALRLTVPNGLAPSSDTVKILKKLYGDLKTMITGTCLEGFPEINDSLHPVDLLVIAETLRLTLASFFSPEEVAEQKKLGFITQ